VVEVQARLRFNAHSLGAVRTRGKPAVDKFLHDPEGQVMFLPTWWGALMKFATKLLNRHHSLVQEIDWDPVIDGTPREYRRFYKPKVFQLHEAFYPGDTIGVNAVLPTGLSVEDFHQLLDVAGKYKGMSPYRAQKKYGTFEVLTVLKRKRMLSSEQATE
jgi:hypothetical protein